MERGDLIHDGVQACPYLSGQMARMPLYRQRRTLSLEEADVRFAMAERRVGWALYRTECMACQACQGLRVLVDDFRMTSSQKRVWKKWKRLGSRLRITFGPVSWSPEKLRLYKKQNGNCDVPQNYKDDRSLGLWVGVQRRSKKNEKLSAERTQRLNDLGFKWSMR